MSIVKRAVENIGGTLGISSREGEGTTVMVRIPLNGEKLA